MGVLIVTHNGRSVSTHQVCATPLVVGCKEDCDVCLTAEGIAQQHLMLVEKDGMVALKQVEPDRVTRVNGADVRDVARIRNGDTIQVGEYQLLYFASGPAAVKVRAGDANAITQGADKTAQGIAGAGNEVEESDDDSPPDSQNDESLQYDEDEYTEPAGRPDSDVVIGEFVEADTAESELLQFGGDSACEPLPVPGPLLEVIHERLGMFARLEELDARRKKYLKDKNIPEQAEREFRRQMREAQELPSAEAAAAHMKKLQDKLADLDERVKAGEAEPYPPILVEATEMAMQQWMVVMEREQLCPAVVEAALPLARKEPLYVLLRAGKIRMADELFGWAIYALALMSLSAEHVQENAQLKKRLAQLEQKPQGLIGRFRGLSDEDRQERERLLERNHQCNQTVMRITRELAAVEKRMVDCFWRVYARTAHLLVKNIGQVGAGEALVLRAFIRFGMLGINPWFLPGDTVRALLESCKDVVDDWDYDMAANHVLYADEYIALVAKGKITPSIDENLELNKRNSPEWKADKAWRRLVHTRISEAALRQTAEQLEGRIREIREEQVLKEKLRSKLIRTAPDYKQRNHELSQAIQHCRVESARLQRSVDRIHQQYLPGLDEVRSDAEAKLEETGCRPGMEYLVSREAAGIHRLARLCANLQDRFPPLSLRERYRPGSGVINDRESMNRELADLERRDPTIFKDALIQVKKKSHRIYLRFCPVVILTPSCGFISYAWNPRHGPEIGRLAVPGYLPRQGIRERMLRNMFADFRWDTSKASAGVDLLTSETLVAEYSKARWEYRRRGKEVREKAGIYNEENDRKNWRRHYALYLSSSLDGGKLLFFKCYEVYEKVILKFLDLPEGVERLRR